MNVIIFTPDILGHHLEYIHHIYLLASKSKNNTYLFLLPRKFNELKINFQWPEENNILFELFEDNMFSKGQNSSAGVLKKAYRVTRFVAQKAKEFSADIVYSNYLILFVPFAPLFFNKSTQIVGIIYKIFLYDNNKESKSTIFERYKFKLMSRSTIFKRIYILNDEQSSAKLNMLYNTTKFQFIPDPFVPLRINGYNIREEYNIPINKTLFVHFGSMNNNKGTIEILESLRKLSGEECKHYSFFFAGHITEEIKGCFYKMYNELKEKLQIIVIDEFCSYDFFASLCSACDCILTPYKRTSQSSGLIGYASQFGKPVIGPNRGLFGYLVNKYGLGLLVDDITPDSLREAYKKISLGAGVSPDNTYCKDNSITAFQKVLVVDIV